MIMHGGFNEIDDLTIMSTGFTKEEFLSLPSEFQKAIILYHWVAPRLKRTNKRENNIKKKVLTLNRQK